MQTVSSRWLPALALDHIVKVSAQIIVGGIGGQASTQALTIESGSVSVDITRPIRRSLSLTIVDPLGTLIPQTPADLLHPDAGNEIVVSRGIDYGDGSTPELMQLGRFSLDTVKLTDPGATAAVTIAITAYDRAWRVQRAKWTDVFQLSAGTDYATAIHQILDNRVPGLTYNFAPTLNADGSQNTISAAKTLGADPTNADPWKDAQDLAAVAGMWLYFDEQGVCTLAPILDGTTQAPVVSYTDFSAMAVPTAPALPYLTGSRTLTADKPNHVLVVSSGTAIVPPVRGEAFDTNLSSPTRFGGPYGNVVESVSTSVVSTAAGAQIMANGLLKAQAGDADAVGFSTIPNPAHQENDLVQVIRPSLGVSGLYVLQAFNVPLDVENPMTFTTRVQQATS